MQCRICGYALWNLKRNTCPECGTPFRVRDYRFEPHSVTFACPSCGQAYYGENEAGLPTYADTFPCSNCGQTVEVDAMPVTPLTPEAERQSGAEVPWEQTQTLGRWTAFWKTFAMGAVQPTELGRALRMSGTWGKAYTYAATAAAVGFVGQGLTWIPFLLLFFGVSATAGAGGGLGTAEWGIMAAITCGGLLGMLLYSLIYPLLITGISAGVTHLILRLTGPMRGDFVVTARSILYTQGLIIVTAVPLCGQHLGAVAMVWAMIASILVLMRSQDVSGGRATFAVLFLPLLFIALYIALIVVIIVMDAQ